MAERTQDEQRDYSAEMSALLRKSIRGLRIRGFVLGYGSMWTERYINSRNKKIFDLEKAAEAVGAEDSLRTGNLMLNNLFYHYCGKAVAAQLLGRDY